MTVDEYIKSNLPFYHVTSMEQLESIKNHGLCRKYSHSRNGICVVRSDDNEIIAEIVDCYLHEIDVPDDTLYALIRILPTKHNISANVVAPDPINEQRGSLYNYLCVDSIKIEEEDIIRTNIPIGLFHGYTMIKDNVGLEDYYIKAPEINNPSTL